MIIDHLSYFFKNCREAFCWLLPVFTPALCFWDQIKSNKENLIKNYVNLWKYFVLVHGKNKDKCCSLVYIWESTCNINLSSRSTVSSSVVPFSFKDVDEVSWMNQTDVDKMFLSVLSLLWLNLTPELLCWSFRRFTVWMWRERIFFISFIWGFI